VTARTPQGDEAADTSDSMTELSIVIATHDSGAFLEPCLTSIVREDVSTDLIVVDNASTDGSIAELTRRFPAARVIGNVVNAGHCRALNQGIAAARAGLVMVLDVDTIIVPGALRGLLDFMRAHPEVAIVAPRMLNTDGSIQETARRFPGVINGLFGRQTLLTRLFPDNRFSRAYLARDRRDDTRPFEVDWVSAACMVFRRDLTTTIGAWDEGFGGYWVDADWCRRAHRAGRVYCLPSARVVHCEQNRSGRRKDARRILQFHAGVSRFYRKHYTAGVLDPRAVAAAVALGCRAALLIAGNRLLPGRGTETGPPATGTPMTVTARAGKDES
jgi:hypothetical protein